MRKGSEERDARDPFRAFLSLCAPLCGTDFFGKPPPSGFRRPASLSGNSIPAVPAGGSPSGARSYASSRRRISRTFAVSSSVAGSMGGAQKGASPTPRSSIAFLITGTNCGATS